MFERYRELLKRREAEGRPDSGFTLIELLIVIVVLGVLAAIVIFSLTGVTGSSEASACNADAKTVETAVSAYNAQNNSFPANMAALSPTYLRTAPVAALATNGYAITLVANTGEVDVQTQKGATISAVTNYDAGGAALCTAL